nr:hypothetical protein [Tanacetum cinerariifolium]
MDSNLIQPPVFTPVDTEMHKEDQQATASFIVHSESASGCDALTDSIAEADLGLSAPSDFVPHQQETVLTQPTTRKRASSIARQIEKEEAFNTIKLEDLAKLVSHDQPSFKDLDSLEDDLVIVVGDSDKDEVIEKDEVNPTLNAETENTSVPKSSSPRLTLLSQCETTQRADDDETTHMPGFMVESSKKKELKKFDFVTENGEHVHLTKEHIIAQKKIEEEAKAKASRCEDLDRSLSEQDPLDRLNDLGKKKRKHANDIHDFFRANKRLKSSVQYKDHPASTVLNEPILVAYILLALKQMKSKQETEFEWKDQKTMLRIGKHVAWWSNFIGELVGEFPMHYSSWHNIEDTKKAYIKGRLMHHFELRPNMIGPRWNDTEKGTEQYFVKRYSDKK